MRGRHLAVVPALRRIRLDMILLLWLDTLLLWALYAWEDCDHATRT